MTELHDLQESWKELGHPPVGCVRCHKTFHEDGSEVQWKCQGCGYLVCRDCTLTLPGTRGLDAIRQGKSGIDQWSLEPSPGGREYYSATLCSKMCWERIGAPEE